MAITTDNNRPPLTVISNSPDVAPPHDLAAEAAALGAALYSPKGATAIAAANPEDFYDPRNKLVAQAIQGLYNKDKPTDAVLVRSELDSTGRLDAAGGEDRLRELLLDAPSYSAEHYLKVVQNHATLRRYIANATQGATAAYSKDFEFAAKSASDSAEIFSKQIDGQSSWGFAELWPVLTNEEQGGTPEILRRSDGQALLYPGRVHAFNAETESGKSWLALYACAEQIAEGNHVIYIDFEDQPKGITDRLQDLGATREQINIQFHYIRPADPISPQTKEILRQGIERFAPTLCIIDGVTEVMAMNGWSITDNDDVALFLKELPRPIAHLGPAVVLIDHVVKNKEGRGKFGIGGQHKLAGLDGSAFGLEVMRPFGRERDGLARLFITKDRPGHLDQAALPNRLVAEMRLLSKGGQLNFALVPPTGTSDPDRSKRLDYMERVSKWMQYQSELQSKNQIVKGVAGDNTALYDAITALAGEGYLEPAGHKSGYARYRLAKPFVAHPEPDPIQEQQEMEDF